MPDAAEKILTELVHLLSLALNAQIDCEKSLPELAGDEYIARQLQKRIIRHFAVDDGIDIDGISLRCLAEQLSEKDREPISGPIVQKLSRFRPVEEWPAEAEFSLPPGMMGMWFLYACSPRTTEYLLPNIVEIIGPVDPEAMEEAWQFLIDRHAALRTVYGHHDGVPYFKVLERNQLDFIWHGAEKWEQSDLDRRILSEATRPFDLTKRPPIRVHLFTQSPERHFLLVVGHHIILDFASFVTLLREFDAVYPAVLHRTELPCLDPADDIRDYVCWHKDRMESVEHKQWGYWKQKLSTLVSLPEFEGIRPRPKSFPHRGAAHRFGSTEPIIAHLKLLARKSNSTLYAVLVSALQVILSHYCCTQAPVITSLMNGRTNREVQNVVGYLVNPVVLNSTLRDEMNYADVISQASQTTKLAFANQDFPFQKVVERLSIERGDGRPPFQQILFVLQLSDGFEQNSLASIVVGEANEIVSIANMPFKGVYYEDPHVQFDMTIAVTAIDGNLKGVVKYSREMFDPSYVAGFADDFLLVLCEMVADPDRKLSDVALKRLNATRHAQGTRNVAFDLEDTFVVL